MKACKIMSNPQDVEPRVLLLCLLGGVGLKSLNDVTKRVQGHITHDLISVYGMKMNSDLLLSVRRSQWTPLSSQGEPAWHVFSSYLSATTSISQQWTVYENRILHIIILRENVLFPIRFILGHLKIMSLGHPLSRLQLIYIGFEFFGNPAPMQSKVKRHVDLSPSKTFLLKGEVPLGLELRLGLAQLPASGDGSADLCSVHD